MGILVLLFLVFAVFGGVFTFQIMQAAFKLPVFLNVPGAFAIGSALFTFFGWLSISFGLFDSYANFRSPPPPEVPWYTWLAYFAIGILWYVTIIAIRHRWRSITNQQNLQKNRDSESWNPEGKSGVEWLR